MTPGIVHVPVHVHHVPVRCIPCTGTLYTMYRHIAYHKYRNAVFTPMFNKSATRRSRADRVPLDIRNAL